MGANAGTIEVATIADVDGHVTIEVWLGEEPSHRHREPIYDGLLQVRDACALPGDLTGNHLGLLWHLPEGAHRARVYTDAPSQHPQWAEHVDFVID